ncbi:hypothetical protein [Streptomyces sp. NPDC127190]|uniref:hypothetical protein n=1 Tax=unclassified Streptomyces TaxID=2593676 RepID=UPI00362EB2F7
MFDQQKIRTAQLLQEAAQDRLVREATRARRAARRERSLGDGAAAAESHTGRLRGRRAPRPA